MRPVASKTSDHGGPALGDESEPVERARARILLGLGRVPVRRGYQQPLSSSSPGASAIPDGWTTVRHRLQWPRWPQRPPPTVRQRQLRRHLPRGLGRPGRGQRRPRARLRRRPLDRRGLPTAPAQTLRDRLRGLLRLQRHRRQLAGAGLALPVLPQRDLPRDRPRRDRRVRRPGVLLQRHQGAAPSAARTARSTPAAVEHMVSKRSRHPLPEAAGGSASPSRPSWARVYTPGGAARPSAAWPGRLGLQRAHGRRPLRQRRRRARRRARRRSPGRPAWTCSASAAPRTGMAVGEAVVFFDRTLADEFDYRCKQAGQLASKMRFLAAPWVGMLEDGAWLRHAAPRQRHGPRCWPRRAGRRPRRDPAPPGPGQRRLRPSLPAGGHRRAAGARLALLHFIGSGGCRFMCAWDTTAEDVRAFAADVRAEAARAR